MDLVRTLRAVSLAFSLSLVPTASTPSIGPTRFNSPIVERNADSEGVFLLFEALKPVRNGISYYIIENEKMGIQYCSELAYKTFLDRLHHFRADEDTIRSWKFVNTIKGFSDREKKMMWVVLSNTDPLLRNFANYLSCLSGSFDSEEYEAIGNEISALSNEIVVGVEAAREDLRRGMPRAWLPKITKKVALFSSLLQKLSNLTKMLCCTK